MLRNGTALAAALCGLLGLVAPLMAADGPGCPSCGTPSCGAPDCGTPCCGKPKCCPTCETKTVNHRCFTDRCEEFCLPCSFFGMLTGKCDYSKVMTRKVMILKIHKEEQCVKKCHVVHEPCCGGCSGGCADGHCGGESHGVVIHDYPVGPYHSVAPSYPVAPAGPPRGVPLGVSAPMPSAPVVMPPARPEAISTQPKQVEGGAVIFPAQPPR